MRLAPDERAGRGKGVTDSNAIQTMRRTAHRIPGIFRHYSRKSITTHDFSIEPAQNINFSDVPNSLDMLVDCCTKNFNFTIFNCQYQTT